jgi:hypothetical protein
MDETFSTESSFASAHWRSTSMIAMVTEEQLQRLANECLHISERTEDARTASDMLRLSHRILQLATPTMPTWRERVPQTHWLAAPSHGITSIVRDAALTAKLWIDKVRLH